MPWILFRYVIVEFIDSKSVNVSQVVTYLVSATN
jgi:hypothetical protein